MVTKPPLALRLTRTLLHPDDRRWLDALVAEAAFAAGGRRRAAWLAGGLQLVLTLDLARAGLRHLVSAVSLALAGLTLTLAATGYEGLSLDDDLYLIATATFAAAALFLLAPVRSSMRRRWPLNASD
jgi:hypothetical protein